MAAESDKFGVAWQPDDEVDACPLCATEFGIFTRKHHCRFCGLVLCAGCLENKATHPRTRSAELICDLCAPDRLRSHQHFRGCARRIVSLIRLRQGKLGMAFSPELAVVRFNGTDSPGLTSRPPLQVGDRVVAVNGAAVSTQAALSIRLAALSVVSTTGPKVRLTVDRNAAPRSRVSGVFESLVSRGSTRGPTGLPRNGFYLKITRRELAIAAFNPTPDGSPHPGRRAEPPLELGDRILKVNGQPIADLDHLAELLKSCGKKARFLVSRGEHTGAPAEEPHASSSDFSSSSDSSQHEPVSAARLAVKRQAVLNTLQRASSEAEMISAMDQARDFNGWQHDPEISAQFAVLKHAVLAHQKMLAARRQAVLSALESAVTESELLQAIDLVRSYADWQRDPEIHSGFAAAKLALKALTAPTQPENNNNGSGARQDRSPSTVLAARVEGDEVSARFTRWALDEHKQDQDKVARLLKTDLSKMKRDYHVIPRLSGLLTSRLQVHVRAERRNTELEQEQRAEQRRRSEESLMQEAFEKVPPGCVLVIVMQEIRWPERLDDFVEFLRKLLPGLDFDGMSCASQHKLSTYKKLYRMLHPNNSLAIKYRTASSKEIQVKLTCAFHELARRVESCERAKQAVGRSTSRSSK